MGSVNIVVFIESLRHIMTRQGGRETNALHLASLIEVSAAWGTLNQVLSSLLIFLTAWRVGRCQVYSFRVLLLSAEAIQPGSGLVGGPQERSVD